jgi:hypothetical protein
MDTYSQFPELHLYFRVLAHNNMYKLVFPWYNTIWGVLFTLHILVNLQRI